jgi:hypothetical protein
MAHTLTPDDLLYPKGDLPLTLFPDKAPGKTAQDALTYWLDQAQLLLTNSAIPLDLHNAAARHFTYAKAYRAEANRLAATPSKVTDSGAPMSQSREWSQDRISYWDKKAEEEEELLEDIIAQVTITPRVVTGRTSPAPVISVW